MKLKMGVIKVAQRSTDLGGVSMIIPVHDPELTISEKEYSRLLGNIYKLDWTVWTKNYKEIIVDTILNELGVVIGDWDAKKSTHREALK